MKRFVAWLILMVVVFVANEWIASSFLPPITSSVSVRQLDNSDEAYMELRQHEQGKNYLTLVSFAVAIVITGIVLVKPVKAWWKEIDVEGDD